ncbi:hypothetical protein, partial [Candidatus Methylacidiphilum fumarolicum]|uniref:hypothetical protein n=1 Tax=Candidatus Methylacidiphilum fumarolicum TaxID=591154 RepID=UPI001ABCC1D7
RFSAQVGNVGRTKNLFRSVAITYDATLRKMGKYRKTFSHLIKMQLSSLGNAFRKLPVLESPQ